MARTALLLIDVVNRFDFPGCGPLVRAALRATPQIARLAQRARAASVPVIYVNDNFGQWRSDFRATVAHCTAVGSPGREVSRVLSPQREDYFVLKPMHSGFHATSLALLLDHLHVGRLVLTGFAANLCVAFTAHDAHMLGYELVVPRDCTAANRPSLTRAALEHMRIALNATTALSRSVVVGTHHARRRTRVSRKATRSS